MANEDVCEWRVDSDSDGDCRFSCGATGGDCRFSCGAADSDCDCRFSGGDCRFPCGAAGGHCLSFPCRCRVVLVGGGVGCDSFPPPPPAQAPDALAAPAVAAAAAAAAALLECRAIVAARSEQSAPRAASSPSPAARLLLLVGTPPTPPGAPVPLATQPPALHLAAGNQASPLQRSTSSGLLAKDAGRWRAKSAVARHPSMRRCVSNTIDRQSK